MTSKESEHHVWVVLGVAAAVRDQLFKQHGDSRAFVVKRTGGEAVALEIVCDDLIVAEDRNERKVRVIVRAHGNVSKMSRCLI